MTTAKPAKLDLNSVLWIGAPALGMLGALASVVVVLGLHIYNTEGAVKERAIAGLQERQDKLDDSLGLLTIQVTNLGGVVDNLNKGMDSMTRSYERMGTWVQNLALAVSKLEK